MRFIDIINDMIPYGHAWSYLRSFVLVLIKMLVGAIVIILLFLFGLMPFAASLINNSPAYILWYFITIPSLVVALKFMSYHLRWDDVF